ncbi:MAG: DUF4397 domain-containing protein [Ideonella sp.]
MRVINATNSHASIDLLANLSSASTGTARDTAGAFVSVGEGSIALQVNDSGAGTSLSATTTTLTKDQAYSLVAYDYDGAVKLALLGENATAPASGSAQWRVFNTALGAGSLDIYLTDTATDLATVSSPNFTLNSSTTVTASSLITVTPGTYRVRVTGTGNRSDLRLDMPSVTIGNQQSAVLLLTPTVGANLVNGGWLLQQGTLSVARNDNARVRLISAVSGATPVAASAGGVVISAGSASPTVGDYVTVPANGVTVKIAGVTVDTASLVLAGGSDVSLLVHGDPATATATAIVDNNFPSAVPSNVKIRLLNGLTGAPLGLILNADFAVLANNVAPGQASQPALTAANTAMRVEVTSSVSQQSLYLQSALNIAGGGVYTMFMLGDSAAPVGVFRKDH